MNKVGQKIKIRYGKIWEINHVKHFGVAIDNKLIFDSHIVNICFEAMQKLLSKLACLITFDRKRIFFKAPFESHFT